MPPNATNNPPDSLNELELLHREDKLRCRGPTPPPDAAAAPCFSWGVPTACGRGRCGGGLLLKEAAGEGLAAGSAAVELAPEDMVCAPVEPVKVSAVGDVSAADSLSEPYRKKRC